MENNTEDLIERDLIREMEHVIHKNAQRISDNSPLTLQELSKTIDEVKMLITLIYFGSFSKENPYVYVLKRKVDVKTWVNALPDIPYASNLYLNENLTPDQTELLEKLKEMAEEKNILLYGIGNVSYAKLLNNSEPITVYADWETWHNPIPSYYTESPEYKAKFPITQGE